VDEGAVDVGHDAPWAEWLGAGVAELAGEALGVADDLWAVDACCSGGERVDAAVAVPGAGVLEDADGERLEVAAACGAVERVLVPDRHSSGASCLGVVSLSHVPASPLRRGQGAD